MPNKRTDEPVASRFGDFDRDNTGGDPVNAHGDRMDRMLDDNADRLESKFADDRDDRGNDGGKRGEPRI